MAMVWPTWARKRVITSVRPVTRWAILIAPSFAEDPPETFGCTWFSPAGASSASMLVISLIGWVW